jgi:uroporphyrinogen-III synthase
VPYAKLRGMKSMTPAGPRWYVISLRPRGLHAPLRRVARAAGFGFIPLSPWRIELREDAATRERLREALAADVIVFSSPVAVQAAARLAALAGLRRVVAVGEGTALALLDAGVERVAHPARMDSEGLLALPELGDIRGRRLGYVTAPGGRGRIAPTLTAQGARVLRADVYARLPCAPLPRARRALCARGPLALALSSGDALRLLLEQLDAEECAGLRTARVVAASARLETLARALGFVDVVRAEGPRPAQLVAALDHDAG